MFEPTGWLFLAFLAACFLALCWWLVKARHLVFRCVAGVLAFSVSALFGVALVNNYYGYLTTWGSVFANASGSGVTSYDPALGARSTPHRPHPASEPIRAPLAHGGHGRIVHLILPSVHSGISRPGYVYIPPQYSNPANADAEYPVVELLHGDPGNAAGWVYGLQIQSQLDSLIDAGTIGPMVVVMPTTFEGRHGDDCVNAPGGLQNDTYLASDVPEDVTQDFRVHREGRYWAIGGLSDGAFCAANLALRHPGRFAAAALMDGFYTPSGDAPTLGRLLGEGSALWRGNDPMATVTEGRTPLPKFWIMSGTGDSTDMRAASAFYNAITVHEPATWLVIDGVGHTTPAWREALPHLLTWTWATVAGEPVHTGITTIAS